MLALLFQEIKFMKNLWKELIRKGHMDRTGQYRIE